MIEVKAITKSFESWGNEIDDFYVSFEVDVGLKSITFSSELFCFDVVSPRRIANMLEDQEIELGHGIMIMNDFNQELVKNKIKELVEKSCDNTEQKSYMNLSKYFNWSSEYPYDL